MNFCSDNSSGVHPRVIEGLAAVNDGAAMPYGDDAVTARSRTLLAEVFERDPGSIEILHVATGTAANSLALALATPPYGAVICHQNSHIQMDECGAPEFYTGGAKLLPLSGTADGKLTPENLASSAVMTWRGFVHRAQPHCLSVTQATETGTVYSPDEILALSSFCKAQGLLLHMDGARFANAVAALGCSPADASWRAGVDILSLGFTKNGAMAAESLIIFAPDRLRERGEEASLRRKRAGHLFSKMRYLSAQIEACLEGGLWLDNARHANEMARKLAAGLAEIPGLRLWRPVTTNQIFPQMPDGLAAHLRAAGFAFYDWPAGGPECRRLVCSWNSPESAITDLLKAAQSWSKAKA